MTYPSQPPVPNGFPAPQAAPKKKKRKILTIALVAVLGMLTLCVGGTIIGLATDGDEKAANVTPAITATSKPPAATPTPTRVGHPDVYARIAAQTDCAVLQKEFDAAEANHKRDMERNRVDLAEIDRSYMEAADARMKEVRCY